MKRRWLIPVLLTTLCAGTSLAMETDQYWAWGRPLEDSTDAINARFNLELERTLASFSPDRQPKSCREVAVTFRKRIRFMLFHTIELWAWNSQWVSRTPNGAEEQREYRRTNLYSRHPFIDTGTWMPFTPTIEVDGVRFGTDKLAHFVSSGWAFYDVYSSALEEGETHEEAERKALRRGLLEERSILGGLTSGVKSIADIQAGYAGMHFYNDLCNGSEPMLRREDGRWIVARPFDLREYVVPRWDESFQPPVYSKTRWRRVRPVMEGYCDRLSDPSVQEQRRRYRERDEESLVTEIVREHVAAGSMADPERFSLDRLCAGLETSADPSAPRTQPAPAPVPASSSDTPRPSDPVDPEAWRERLVEEDEDRRKFALGLVGAQLSYPQLVTASLAVMPTSQPRDYDCGTPCEYRGPFVQLRPGLGGGSLSVGWGRVTGNANRSGTILDTVFIGLLYKLTVLRTWGDHGALEPNQTYAGPELALPVGRANLALGVLHRIGDGPDRTWFVSSSVGWGF